MRADVRGNTGGGLFGGATGAPDLPGRIDIAPRVLTKVTREASAAAIGVPRDDVSVDVSDFRDGMAVRVSAPLPIPDLNDTAAVSAAAPVLERAAQLQGDLRDRLSGMLGREVVRVNLVITGATTPPKRRVR